MRLPMSACLKCGQSLDAATAAFGAAEPLPGDFSVCIHCGHIMAFDTEMKLRRLTGKEKKEAAQHRDLPKVRKAWQRLHQ